MLSSVVRSIVVAVVLGVAVFSLGRAAHAQVATPSTPTPSLPTITMPNTVAPRPDIPASPGDAIGSDGSKSDASININLDNLTGKTNNSKGGQTVALLLLFGLMAVAPSLIMMLTSFTRIVIVLSLTRNAIGLQMAPPNQVIVGLSLFLTFFVMAPTLQVMNKDALQPLLKGEITTQQAYNRAVVPLKAFMLKQTGKSELAMFENVNAKTTTPADSAAPAAAPGAALGKNVSMVALVPAFILSELKAAFIIGFVIFIPFLVIDLIVSSSLMSMGMFMLPPVLVSLPFKLMLFVLVDGWALIVESLLKSFNT